MTFSPLLENIYKQERWGEKGGVGHETKGIEPGMLHLDGPLGHQDASGKSNLKTSLWNSQ